MFDYDVILLPKSMKFLEVGNWCAGLRSSHKSLFSIKNAILKNLSSIVTSPRRHRPPYDPHLSMMINEDKFIEYEYPVVSEKVYRV